MDNIRLEDYYDAVSKCKKCGKEYGYDYPKKFIKSICGKKIKLPGYKDNGLCPQHDPSCKEKPKALNTSDSINNHLLETK